MFFSFYSIFCLGSTKNEVHICNLHAKTQLLMYDKGGLSTKKFSTPEGRWRTVRKPGLDENSGFEWKNLYFQYQWPKRNSFQGYSFLISKKVLFWHTLMTTSNHRFIVIIYLISVLWQTCCPGFSHKSVWAPRKLQWQRNIECFETRQTRQWVWVQGRNVW